MLRPTCGGFFADRRNAAPPDLLTSVTAPVESGSGSGQARTMATNPLASYAGLVTAIHSAAASDRTAQR
ncbi:hypothetical protein AB0C02_29275 [Micromonospora sp. NPDC048999]|uniref:hypothetical protein n=1 Tax=Micromonospora sp. NPDC048999 TaxID=3155391 RepID=UPI0033D218F8